jgi:RNAse (barnase) inhibitor barstar
MITQELLGYIKEEIAKGRTREEINKTLVSAGGWDDNDISEAFRTIIPMQSVITPNPVAGAKIVEPASLIQPIQPEKEKLIEPVIPTTLSPKPSSSHSLLLFFKFLIILIIIGGLGFGVWYYRSNLTNLPSQAMNLLNYSGEQMDNLWASLTNKVKGINFSFLNENKNVVSNTPVANNTNNTVAQKLAIKDCGTGVAPQLGGSFANNPVLSCLGASALNCENAKGVLKDDFFPTVFEINKSQNSCNFKLSYLGSSPLVDITGKKLAGQYILCPINIVKAIDNTSSTSPKFVAADKTNASKYASQIYFYGTLGLFVENNLDQTKIQNLGCSGEYIQSMIASYKTGKTK